MIPSMLSHQAVEDDMSKSEIQSFLTYETIDLNKILAQSHDEESGAIVMFSGEVRKFHLGKEVSYLQYEAFESMANTMIKTILEEATQRWELNGAYAIHRLGTVGLKESAVCVITTSPHRKEAYDANQYIIHRIKHEVPIWKKEVYVDGTSAWGNNCNCADPNKHEPFV
jgi:molybdopterin synthase catalytic subunit